MSLQASACCKSDGMTTAAGACSGTGARVSEEAGCCTHSCMGTSVDTSDTGSSDDLATALAFTLAFASGASATTLRDFFSAGAGV